MHHIVVQVIAYGRLRRQALAMFNFEPNQ